MRGLRGRAGAAAALAGPLLAVLAGCTAGHGSTYDGSCSTSPAYRTRLLALDAPTGTEAWLRTLPHPRDQAPEVADGLVLLRGCGALVLDAADGRRRLRQPGDEADLLGLAGGSLVRVTDAEVRAEAVDGDGGGLVARSTPPWQDVALVGPLFVADDAGTLVAHGVRRGSEIWRAALPGAAGRTEYLLDGDALVARTADGSVYRLDAGTGTVRWRALPRDTGELGYDRLLALGSGTVVVTASSTTVGPSTTLVALDLASGDERWRRTVTPTRPGTRQLLPLVDGVLVVPTTDGLHGLDARTGAERWRLEARSEAPVAAGTAVVVDDEASAFAVDPRHGTVLWRRATTHRPLVGADPVSGTAVVLDSPPVPHGRDDCC